MSHYDLVLDLAKMYDARSQARQTASNKSTAKATGMQQRVLPLMMMLLLINQTAAMSLDRLALERNELSAAEPTAASSAVIVDDMKMAAVPANGNMDMYMLVPESVAGQLDDTEHVHRNTIDGDSDADADSDAAENADMLMLESDDTPAMQLVELPSDITMAEVAPEAHTESELVAEPEAEAAVGSPELIEEHVVEHPVEGIEHSAEQVQSQLSSQEAQLENAENVVETATEAQAQVVANSESVQADDAREQQEIASATEEALKVQAEPEQEQEQHQENEKQTEEEDKEKELASLDESKSEIESAADSEVDTTEASMLESMAEGIEEGLNAVMSDLLPSVSADSQQDDAAIDAEVEPSEFVAQTALPEIAIESATEQQLQEDNNETGIPVQNDEADVQEAQVAQAELIESQADNQAKPQIEAEPVAEHNAEVQPAEISQDSQNQQDADIQPEADVQPVAEIIPEGEIQQEAEVQPESEIQQEAEVQPEAEIQQDAGLQSEADAQPEFVAQPEIIAQPEAETQSEPEVEMHQDAQPDADIQPEGEVQQDAEAQPEAEPQPEVQPQPSTEAQSEPEAQPEDVASQELESQPEVELVSQAQPQTESETLSQTETETQPETVKKETQNNAESIPSPEAIISAVINEPEVANETELLEKQPENENPTAETAKQPEIQADETPQVPAIQPEAEAAKPSEQSILTTIIPVVAPQASQMLHNPEPIQVLDSVLNYVNASFMQHQQEDLQKTEVEEAAVNANLRRYDGAQVWRIVVQTDKDKKLADELQSKYDGQLWKEVKQEVDYLLKPQVLAAAERHIRAANLSRIVLIDNLQQVIEVENPPAEKIAELQNRKGHRLTWQAYHRLEDIHGFIDYLAKTYPDICSTEIIGYSVEKRPLKILKISNGKPGNPSIWIDGGMHAREWISSATVSFIANQLAEGNDELPEYLQKFDFYIHIVANPDGYEYSHTTDRLWRKNMRAHGRQCPGVDLNRNFGYKWGGKGTSASPCSQTYRGSKAFSEPETFYISKFISSFPRNTFQAYLSFHSYGQYILYPWGYDYQLTKDRADLDRVARQAGSIITKSSGIKYTVGSSATTLYPAAGGSDDWAKGIAGIKYAYTIEMGDTGRYGFVLPAQFIEHNGRDGFTFVDTVARAIYQGYNNGSDTSRSNGRRRFH